MDISDIFSAFYELAVWALALVVFGYLLLLRGAFYLFASESNAKSVVGGFALLVLLGASLLLLYWVILGGLRR